MSATQNTGGPELRAYLLDIARDTYGLLTLALQDQDTRQHMLDLVAAQPESRRADYITRVTRDLATITASVMIKAHGGTEAAQQAHREAILALETLAPHLGVTTRHTGTQDQQP